MFLSADAAREDERGAGGRGGPVKGAQPQLQKRAHREVPAHQAKALEQAGAEGVGVTWSEQMQSPLSVRGQDLGARRAFSAGKGLQVRKGAPWKDNAIAVMDNLAPLFGVADAEAEFEVKRVDEDKLGFRHVRLTQRHQGLKVLGGEVIVHFNADEAAYEVNGQYAPAIAVGIQPGLTVAAATKIALDDLVVMGYANGAATKAPERVIYALNGVEPRLAYEMLLSGKDPWWCWRYWIDAQTGDVLLKYNDVKNIAAPTEAGEHTEIQGSILEGEGGHVVQVEGWLEDGIYYLYNTNLNWVVYNDSFFTWLYPDARDYAYRMTNDWGDSDRTEMSVAYNVNATQRYYREVHGRNSWDNNGAMASVYVHYGFNYVNAGWSSELQRLVIGDGDGEEANSLGVLDIMAHEVQHAVTDETADLIYAYEPGALCESFSDIFGACVEFYTQPDGRAAYPEAIPGTANWLMGEDCWLSSTATRDMRNPRNTDVVGEGNEQPSRYQGTYWWYGLGDYGGVHYNSGPHNFLFYLLCEGGVGDNDGLPYDVEGIGIQWAEQIAYRVLTVYCTQSTNYEAVREAWYSATRDLIVAGLIPYEYLACVRHAWDAIMGVQEPPVITTANPLPDGRVGNFYSVSFTATSSPSPVYRWYLVDGTLPSMLTFSPDGKLSGYCLQSGTFTFSVAVEANNGLITTNEFSMYVRPPLEAPFFEGFEQEQTLEEELTGWLQQQIYGGNGWRFKNGGVVSGMPAAAIEGSKNAYLGRWNDSATLNLPQHEAWLVSPMIRFPSDARTAQLRFYLYMDKWGSQQDELRVYCKTDLFAGWGEPIATYTSSINAWRLQVIDLPPLSEGGDYFIAFQGRAIGGTGICIDSIWIGDPTPPLAIITPPILPIALVETNYTNLVTLEATGGWSDDPGEYTYEVIGGSMPEGFGLTPDGVVTGCSAVVTSSTFLVQVTDSQGRTATLEMTLLVELPRAPVFEEGFEGSLVGGGWTQERHPQTGNNISWQITAYEEKGFQLPIYNAHSPKKFAWFYGVPSAGSIMNVKLVSESLDLSQAPNNTRLSFWHIMQQQGGKQDQLTVFYRISKNDPWVQLVNYRDNVTNWTHRVVQLPNLSSTYQIAFEGYALGGRGVGVDTVSITDDAAAPIITTLSTLPGSFRGFPYYTALSAIGGMPPYSWALVSGALPPGLTMNTDGEISGTSTVSMSAAFGVEVMGADGKASTNLFTLRILEPGDIPFEEKFDSPTLPEGWTVERQGSVDWVITRGTTSTASNAQPKAPPEGLASNACLWSSSMVTTVARLVSPPINLGNIEGDATLTFQHCMVNYFSSYDRLLVRYRTSLTDEWKTVADFAQPALKWIPRTVTLPNPSSTYYIAFEGHVKGGHGVCVGDVVVMGTPSEAESPFDAWRREHFTEEELDDPNISGPDADPDGDGIPNLLEYAMGLDPKVGDVEAWIWGGLTNVVDYAYADVPTDTYLYLKYRRLNVVEGVKFTVIGTPSLTPPDLNWSPIRILELEPWTPGTEPEVWSWVHTIHTEPVTNYPTYFMRLRVELVDE